MQNPFLGRLKRFFFAGLAALLPTILTIGVLIFCWGVLREHVAGNIDLALESILRTQIARELYWEGMHGLEAADLAEQPPPGVAPEDFIPFSRRVELHVPPWVGILLAFALVLVVGVLITGFLGKKLLRAAEAGFKRIPVIKTIYPYAKQVTEFFFEGRRPLQFSTAVAIEYPRKGVWSIGFVMNEEFVDLSRRAGEPVVVVFMPSSPTPISGYTIVVPKRDVVPLSLSVDEAFRFCVSGGVLLPPAQLGSVLAPNSAAGADGAASAG